MSLRRSFRQRSGALVALASLGLLSACGGGSALFGIPTTSSTTSTTSSPSGSPGGGGSASPAAPTTSQSTDQPTTTEPTATQPSTLDWRSCGGSLKGLQCATLAVPVNYADPHGPTIKLALDRIRATGSRLGSVLINPGGPGASGLQFLPEVYPQLASGLTTHFDLIGFDPRGVGASSPIICGTGPQLDQYFSVNFGPTTPAGVAALMSADRQFDQRCLKNAGALLGQVGTVDAARDMESIRVALGDPKLNYLGFSYGTFLGATYAEMFPTHIRAMVLDGAENPDLNAITSIDAQSVALDGDLNQFFDWCAQGNGCRWKPSGGRSAMQAAVLALINSTVTHPLPTSSARTVGTNQVIFGIGEALYDQSFWPDLGLALANAQKGNGSTLLTLYDQYVMRGANGQYQNLLEADAAVSCEDTPKPTEAAVLAAGPAAARAAPVFGLSNLYGLLQCVDWPTTPTDRPHAITAAGSPPIVVVGTTGDPATPYAGAQALAHQLSKGVLVTRVGEGHTGYLFSACVRKAVDTYMVDLTPPKTGTSCSTDS